MAALQGYPPPRPNLQYQPHSQYALPQVSQPPQQLGHGQYASRSPYAAPFPVIRTPTVPGVAIPQNPWMPRPVELHGCPRGLEYLTQVDQILIHQELDISLLEIFTEWESVNKFAIKNSMGQNVYAAVEESNCCCRLCLREQRNFVMKIYDNGKNEVMRLHRPLRCELGFLPCCQQEMTIWSPPGTIIGHLQQVCDLFVPKFRINNEFGQHILNISGPCFTCSLCGEVEFRVLTKGNIQIGKISKQWGGLVKEVFTKTTNFGISFPMDLDVKLKACLVGASFLINYMFFESNFFKEACCSEE